MTKYPWRYACPKGHRSVRRYSGYCPVCQTYGSVRDLKTGEITMQELSDEELETLANTPIARLALSCRSLVDVSEDLKESPILWEQLVHDTQTRASRINADETAENVIEAFLESVERFGGLTLPNADAEQTTLEENNNE